MLALHGIPLAIQIALPAIALTWLAARPQSSRQWVLKIAATLCILLAVHLGGLWVVLPWYTTSAFAMVFAAIVGRQTRSIVRDGRQPRRRRLTSIAGDAIVASIAVASIVVVWMGRQPPATPIDLRFPLAGGTYQAVNAGSNQAINAHLMTLTGDRFRAYRGQSYGVDLVKLNAFGVRAAGLLPPDPRDYAIYGDPVLAPCDGIVVQHTDDAPDMTPPLADRTRMAGNHVLLDCGGVHVLLAHFQPGSLRVRSGDRVTTGDVVGVVGNSGNSNEPHLHVHAQRPAAGGEPLSGDPLPITFDGRYLARNNRVQAVSHEP